MRLGVLGPLSVADDAGREILVAAARQRALLAVLLVRANRAVSTDELVELVWDGAPPPTGMRTVRSYMARLRHALGPAVAARIVTRDPGYLCRVATDEMDMLHFEALCARGREALRAREWAKTARATADALGLWRGTPLLDVPSQALRDQIVPRLEQLRVQALEDRITAELALGRHDGVVPDLREAIATHPLHEHFHTQLMVALARAGRQAEGLAAYRQAREMLVEQLGVEPGPELRRTHERILAGDAGLVTPASPEPVVLPVQSHTVVPRQLPAAPEHFIGRDIELDQLAAFAQGSDPASSTVVISAIDGMAGIGKTALAVHTAHRLAEKFPDGQLFLDLRGYTQGHPPRTAEEALSWLLGALGVPPQSIPADGEQAAALYRQRLSATRTLIVLDNAASEAQVRPLLPGSGSCLVLVTSRRRLKGLDDAHSLSLDLLPPPDAVALLRAVAGPGRIPADDPLAGKIARLCGYLPLALRISGALLRHRPAWSLEHLAELLRDQRQRVSVLSDGDRELAGVFDLSYANLQAPHQRLWRSLGLVPGPDLDAYAAAALVQVEPAAATGLLENLVDHNLLNAYAPGRYRLHDLLRAHARALATDPEFEREAALDRLLHYYAHTAQSASILIARYPRPQPDGPAPAHRPTLTEQDAARTWLRTERPDVEAAYAHACTYGLDGHAIALAAGLANILRTDGPFTRAREIHQTAAEMAERLSHPAAHANALIDLGLVRQLTGNYPEADDAYNQALELFHALGHRYGEALALANLGCVRHLIGDYPGAGDALTRALELYRALGHRLGNAGAVAELGYVRFLTGDYPEAVDALAQALELYRALGHRQGEATALTYLGRVRFLTGDFPRAGDALARATEILRALGDRGNEAVALNDYAAVLAATGQRAHALALYRQALAVHRELNKPDDEAVSLEGIAECHLATGDPTQGTAHLHDALEIYQRLGMASGERRVQNRLDDLTADHRAR